MKELYYFNGEYLEAKDISISPFDYGFNFGAGIYEVCGFYRGVSFQLAEHLTRLCRGGDGLALPVDRTEVEKVCNTLIEQNAGESGYLYIQLTFGDYGKRNHHLPKTIEPTLLVYTLNVSSPSTEVFNRGFSLQTAADTRWQRCDLKTISLLPNIITLRGAVAQGFDDCLFVDEQGYALECSAANIFYVENGVLKTPPENNKILPGITRATVIELAKKNFIEVDVCACSIEQLKQADEVFISSTTKQLLPIGTIDNQAMRSVPGEVTKKLFSKWQQFVEQAVTGKK